MQIERRFVPAAASRVQLRARGEGETPLIEGYAAVFYNPADPGTEYELWEGCRERIMPGAFDRAVRERDDARCLFNHDPSQLLGRVGANTVTLSVDAHGLRYSNLPPNTADGTKVIELIRRGDVYGSSFAMVVTDQAWRETDGVDIREILAVQLYDVSPVTYPAYEATSTALRAAGDLAEVRAAHESWRNAMAAALPVGTRLAGYRLRAMQIRANEEFSS